MPLLIASFAALMSFSPPDSLPLIERYAIFADARHATARNAYRHAAMLPPRQMRYARCGYAAAPPPIAKMLTLFRGAMRF